jgi:hypothetical protein
MSKNFSLVSYSNLIKTIKVYGMVQSIVYDEHHNVKNVTTIETPVRDCEILPNETYTPICLDLNNTQF